jgi:outer membrane protein
MRRYDVPGLALAIALVSSVPVTVTAQESRGEVYSLERAIQAALANSHDIAAAEQAVRLAGQQVREAWSSVFPEITANASYSRNLQVQQGFLPAQFFDPNAAPEDVIPVRFGSDNTWQAGMSLNQPLFEYDVFVGVGAAARYRSLEGERMRETTQRVVTAVRRAYLSTLLAREELRLTENSIERVQQTLAETQALNRTGLASDYDVLRLEVEFANLEPSLRRMQNRVSEERRKLLIEIGMDPDAELDLDGSLAEVNIADVAANSPANQRLIELTGLPVEADLAFDDLSELLVTRRSNLRQARMSINLEESRLASQKAEYFPKLSLFSNYNVTAQTNGAWFADFYGGKNNRTTSAVTGVSISIPVFQGFARDARVQQTIATIHEQEAQLDRLEKEAVSQVRTSLERFEETQLRVRSQSRAVQQATRGFEIASAEYREGVGSQLQVTDAELALRQSEFNYAQAIYDYLDARVSLDDAVGTVPTAAGELTTRLGDRGTP